MITYDDRVNASLIEMRADSKRFPRVGAVPREIAIGNMKKIVYNAYLYRGQTADGTAVDYISSALIDELLSGYDQGTEYISFAEISRLVKRAILRDEMFGISVASIYKVIIEYINGEGRELTMRVREQRYAESSKPVPGGSDLTPMIDVYAGALLKNSRI